MWDFGKGASNLWLEALALLHHEGDLLPPTSYLCGSEGSEKSGELLTGPHNFLEFHFLDNRDIIRR